jgi:hypothetical protein
MCPRGELNAVRGKSLSLQKIEPKFLDHPACCLVTILVELSWLRPRLQYNHNHPTSCAVFPENFRLFIWEEKMLKLMVSRWPNWMSRYVWFFFYICDREIGSAANVAQWWWYVALGVVHWSAEASQGSFPLATGRGDRTGTLPLKIDTSCQIHRVPSFIDEECLLKGNTHSDTTYNLKNLAFLLRRVGHGISTKLLQLLMSLPLRQNQRIYVMNQYKLY